MNGKLLKLRAHPWIYITMICLLLLMTGYAAGRLFGSRWLEGVLLRENRFPLLLFRPVNRYYDVYAMINSGNPFTRLSGYYSLLDNRMIDPGFLIDRYKREQLIPTQRTLLWILSFSKDTAAVADFYGSIYSSSDDSLKGDILLFMRRIDKRYYEKFTRDNKIEDKNIYN